MLNTNNLFILYKNSFNLFNPYLTVFSHKKSYYFKLKNTMALLKPGQRSVYGLFSKS